MIEVPMPQLGESVAEGTVTKWLVAEGDYVKREQVLLEVATDKADTEVRAPADGRVVKLIAQEGAIIAKGGALCALDENASAPANQAPPPAAAPPRGATSGSAMSGSPMSGSPMSGSAMSGAPPPVSASLAANSGGAGAPLASPSTRRIALERGVDVNQVRGTGEQGRVTHQDVMQAASSPARSAQPTAATTPAAATRSAAAPAAGAATISPADAAELSAMLAAGGGFVPPVPGVGYGAYKLPTYFPKPGDQVVPFNRRRQITADHMVYSKQVSPHVATVAEVDLYATSKLRDQHKARLKKEGVPLTFLAFICAATVRALRETPSMNARVLDKSYVVLRDIHLGVAVDTPGGLVVPSIKNADQLSLRGIAAAIDEVAQRAKAGKVTADDLSGTSFSVSNPGLRGNLFGAAIIAQPNVGILRVGEIKKRPVVIEANDEDTIAIHPVMYLALSYDHRIIDGVAANAFLWRVNDILSRADFEVT